MQWVLVHWYACDDGMCGLLYNALKDVVSVSAGQQEGCLVWGFGHTNRLAQGRSPSLDYGLETGLDLVVGLSLVSPLCA